MSAFIHKPKHLRNEIFLHPLHTKTLWDKVWTAARKQRWFPKDENTIGYVGNEDGYFYFQMRGLATGFARFKI